MRATPRDNLWTVISTGLKKARSAMVVTAGLGALAFIATVALIVMSVTNVSEQQVVTLATASFGVVAAVIGAYFGVNASANARDAMKEVAIAAQTGAQPPVADVEEPIGEEIDEAAVYGERPVNADDLAATIDDDALDDETLEDQRDVAVLAGDIEEEGP